MKTAMLSQRINAAYIDPRERRQPAGFDSDKLDPAPSETIMICSYIYV
jgi:hypothetical protein